LFKPSVEKNLKSIIRHKLGAKENMMIFSEGTERPIQNVKVPVEKRGIFSLSDKDAEQIGKWCYSIEKHYKQSMDIEWAKDGVTGELFILQARPETVHSKKNTLVINEYKLLSDSKQL
jgi:pyruvate,water dikinase